MKRQELTTGSFDLFLDTICNTFGGIVFLAILLAILIQTRAIVKTPDQSEESPLSAEQVRELITELDDANANYASIASALEALPEPEVLQDDSEYRDLKQDYETLEESVAASIREQSRRTKALAEQLAENAKISEEIAAVPEELDRVASDVKEKSASLQSMVTSRQTTVRLPRDRASSAAPVLGLLQGSRFYFAKHPSYSLRAFNDDAVSTRPAPGDGITVTPRRGRGWSLNDPKLQTMIKSARDRGHIVTIAVWPDSYGHFPEVKRALVNNQVPYQLWPQQQGEELTLHFGSGPSRVQ